eukprot:3845628-Amphidinium_carterae.1
MGDRRERVFEQSSKCPYSGEAEGSASYTLYKCPAFDLQRKQAAVPDPREDISKCVRVLGLRSFLVHFSVRRRYPLARLRMRYFLLTAAGSTPPSLIADAVDAASQEKQPSSLTLCQAAGSRIVTDCKGAAVVADKLKYGLRCPKSRHSRIETRIRDSIGQIEVQWMRSHLTAQQAAEADLPAGYLTGNAEADLLAGQAVMAVPTLPPLLDLFRTAAAAA